MKHTCMACGEKLGQIRCAARIKGMEVSLCVEDAKSCENCESIRCFMVSHGDE